MAEYLAPGVYVEEIEIGGKPIEGVGTSTAGFLGETERGPTDVRLLTSFAEYQRLYGRHSWEGSKSYLPYAVEGFFANGGKRAFLGRILPKAAKEASLELATGVTINALGGGEWGKRIAVKVGSASSGKDLEAPDNKSFKLTVMYWNALPSGAADGGGGAPAGSPPDEMPTESTGDAAPTGSPTDGPKGGKKTTGPRGARLPIRSEPSKKAKQADPDLVETFDELSLDPSSPAYFVRKINGVSSLVSVVVAADGKLEAKDLPGFRGEKPLKGGAGGAVGLEDYKGRPRTKDTSATGLQGFVEVDEISMVCVPNETDLELVGLTGEIVTHCENLKDRFAILQCKQDEKLEDLRPPLDSKYAAFYYPWLQVIDPATGDRKLVPPGGHMAGIYARSDIERGVHKAPANEVVRGAVGLQLSVTKEQQDLLNPRGVNCTRSFVGRGIRVWGARTTSSDPIWKYVNVRRLFLFLEESIEEATQWVVFEPNNERLWARVRQSVSDFLTRVWRDGALMGVTPEEAFFVRCDKPTTMTDNDVENGRLIMVIGVAPVRPAEFVIFRIAQWRSGSAITD